MIGGDCEGGVREVRTRPRCIGRARQGKAGRQAGRGGTDGVFQCNYDIKRPSRGKPLGFKVIVINTLHVPPPSFSAVPAQTHTHPLQSIQGMYTV